MQRIGCRLERISRILQRIAGILHGGQLVAFHAFQLVDGDPRLTVGLRAVQLQRGLQRVHMLGHHVVVQVLSVVRHGG